jgi:hypothetical protein
MPTRPKTESNPTNVLPFFSVYVLPRFIIGTCNKHHYKMLQAPIYKMPGRSKYGKYH